MIFVPPFGGYNKKIFRLASLAVICTPHLCKRCAAPAYRSLRRLYSLAYRIRFASALFSAYGTSILTRSDLGLDRDLPQTVPGSVKMNPCVKFSPDRLSRSADYKEHRHADRHP